GPRHAVVAAVEDAVHPAFAAGILGVGAEDVTAGLQKTLCHRLAVLGQEQYRTAAGVNLGHELGKAAGSGQVDACARFAAVPVAAGDRRAPWARANSRVSAFSFQGRLPFNSNA